MTFVRAKNFGARELESYVLGVCEMTHVGIRSIILLFHLSW